MLRELRITGLGVVEELALELHPGLNVLTGETGAGKTMVTVGLALALGGRASASLVRTGAKAARVEALFDASPATDAAGWSEDGDLILARTVGADGKGTARAGGQSVPVSTLASIGDALVEVHGQHESTRLLSPAAQAAFLDRYAGSEHVAALAALGAEVEVRTGTAASTGATTPDARADAVLPAALQRALYFVCLEALDNAVRHGGPGVHVEIDLAVADAEIVLRVRDDGAGFVPSRPEAESGIQHMADRVRALGGHLQIESSRDGTCVVAAIPRRPR